MQGQRNLPCRSRCWRAFTLRYNIPSRRTWQSMQHVGLSYSQVRIWFKERRRKERKHMEAAGVHMETQVSAGSTGLSCSSSSRSTSLVGKKHMLRPQVLLPKDYILRKVFRKDGPSLGGEFDPLPRSAHGHARAADTTGHHSYQDQGVVKKTKRERSWRLLPRDPFCHVRTMIL
ncbi:hypothetical protein ACQ4PT_045348 [Festuca glaucescens]